MDVYFRIARHGAEGYVLQLVGGDELHATTPAPQIDGMSQGFFLTEARCAAYLREAVGITADRIQGSLGALAAGVVHPCTRLPLSAGEARRVIEQGYPSDAEQRTSDTAW